MVDYSIDFNQFENMIKFAENTIDEIKIRYSPSGININAVDMANVSLATIHIPNTSLNRYHCDDAEQIRTLDVEYVKKFLPKMKTFGSIIEVEHNDGNIIISCGNYEMQMATPKPGSIRREPRIPNVQLDTVFEVGSSMWNKAMLSMTGYFKLIVPENDNAPYVIGKATPKQKTENEINIKVDFDGICNVIESTKLESLYDSEYMVDVSKLLPKIAPNVCVRLSKNMPIKLTSTSNKGEIYTWMQAPRIDDME